MIGSLRCDRCKQPFVPSGRRRFCSDACRQAAYRDRQAATAEASPASQPVQRQAVVYECPSCEQRYLDLRRCEICNLFCRRIGAGGLCPHCSELVAYQDLAT